MELQYKNWVWVERRGLQPDSLEPLQRFSSGYLLDKHDILSTGNDRTFYLFWFPCGMQAHAAWLVNTAWTTKAETRKRPKNLVSSVQVLNIHRQISDYGDGTVPNWTDSLELLQKIIISLIKGQFESCSGKREKEKKHFNTNITASEMINGTNARPSLRTW